MYVAINEMFEKSKENLLTSKVMEVVELSGSSLLSNEGPIPFLNKVKKSCDDASKNSFKEWKNKINNDVGPMIEEYKEKMQQEYLAALAEEEARMRRNKNIIKHTIICIVLFIIGMVGYEEGKSTNMFTSGLSMIILCYITFYFHFYLIRWIWKKIFG